MKKLNIKNSLFQLKEKIQFLKPGNESGIDEELQEADLQVEEERLSEEETDETEPKTQIWEKLKQSIIWEYRIRIMIVCLIILIILGFVSYNKRHLFRDYIITDTYENSVSLGTMYQSVGRSIFRFNTDGVSCVNRKNDLKWSITYNMQAPISDVCDKTLVIAEQQGNQVYVVNEDGLVGHFESLLPIMKVRVSRQGVVALVVEEDDITWIKLYQPDGTVIANLKTSIPESGYPLDIDLSQDGTRLVASYLGISEGIIRDNIVFYDFSVDGQTLDDNIISTNTYTDLVIPEVYFLDKTEAAAVADNCFLVFSGKKMKESEKVTFEEEIVSSFHDNSKIGFLFKNEEGEYKYRLELYSYGGKKINKTLVDAEFDKIKVQNGQILMYNDHHLDIFYSSGKKRLSTDYEKPVVEIFNFNEYRKYLVITQDSFDKIRISG